jgi:hypothetical protein
MGLFRRKPSAMDQIALLRGVDDPTVNFRRAPCSSCGELTWIPRRELATRTFEQQLFVEAVICPRCETRIQGQQLDHGYGFRPGPPTVSRSHQADPAPPVVAPAQLPEAPAPHPTPAGPSTALPEVGRPSDKSVATPPGPSARPKAPPGRWTRWKARRKERRALRRLRRVERKALRRRRKEGLRTLDAIRRSEVGSEAWRQELAESWEAWDQEESMRIQADRLDSLRVLYPTATEESLEELLARFHRKAP